MKKMHIKRKKIIIKRKNQIVILILLIIYSVIIFLSYLNKKISPALLKYGQIETEKLASIIINNAINKHVTEKIQIDELFLIVTENEEIKSIDFNPIIVNKILTETTNNVQINLKYIEQGKVDSLDIDVENLIDYDIAKLKQGIIYEIPSLVFLNNALLANIGPKIPVKFNLIGNITSYINTEITNYGINNALIEVNIILELKEQVILPFTSEQINIKTTIPVAIKLVQGSVPEYYTNGYNQNTPLFSLPLN